MDNDEKQARQAVIDGKLDEVEFVKRPKLPKLPKLPIVSIGPSGLGGPYQKEI
tara:strand:- start:13262 stop:13420 length:159 start_codon:yes stop_codon:yes gene_type:complete